MRQSSSETFEWLKPNRNSAQPLQAQIARWLETLVTTGQVGPGDRLPAEATFVERLGVSRVTVRLAMDELVSKGLVTRAHGKGSFVSATMVPHDMSSGQGFFDSLLARAVDPEARLLSFEPVVPPASIGRLLGASPGRRLPRIERLYLSAGRPVGWSTGWLTPEADKLTSADVATRSTATIHAEILRRPVVSATMHISAQLAGTQAARHLRLRSRAPVLILTRSRFDAAGCIRDHSRFTVNPVAFDLTVSTDVRSEALPARRYVAAA